MPQILHARQCYPLRAWSTDSHHLPAMPSRTHDPLSVKPSNMHWAGEYFGMVCDGALQNGNNKCWPHRVRVKASLMKTSSLNGGVFAQRGHSANHYVVYLGSTPAHHPRTEACMIHSKQHRGCGVQDPGTRGYRWWRTADFSHSARCAPNRT